MSLYDDLGVETSDSKTEGWSKNFKLLQSQLQVKKAALTQAKVRCPHAWEQRSTKHVPPREHGYFGFSSACVSNAEGKRVYGERP